MAKQDKLYLVLLFFVVFLSFFVGSRVGLDPDFGWHLRIGQLIAESGIPATDPFSYTMPSYPYVDHEWLINIGIAKLYPVIGISGLAFIFAVFAVLAVGIMMHFARTKWQVIPVLLATAGLLPFLGIRPQIFSWVFVSILLWILLQKKMWERWRWFSPLFFILWVNMHGSFPLGLSLIFITVLVRSFIQRRIFISDVIISLLCLGATFVNPYVWGVWWEVWMTISDGMLRYKIIEWNPTFSAPIYGFILLLPLSVLLMFRYQKKYTLLEKVLYAWLLALGISSSRHAAFWLLIAIPLTARAFFYFSEEIKIHQLSRMRFIIVYKSLFIFISVILGANIFFNTLRMTSSYHLSYPQKAVMYLASHPTQGNILAEYGWGGYLLWQLPEKKVFIDGRMPSWRNEEAPKNESRYAFEDHLSVMRGEVEAKQLLSKYTITTVMLSSTDDTNLVELVEGFLPFELPIPKRKRLVERLKDAGMEIVYHDDKVLIYQRK